MLKKYHNPLWYSSPVLLRIKFFPIETQSKLNEGSEIFYNEKPVGKILISEPYPFALINLFSPDFQEFCDKELTCDNQKVKII